MKPRLRTEPEASVELAETVLWTEQQRRGLDAEFLEAIEAVLDGRPVAGSNHRIEIP